MSTQYYYLVASLPGLAFSVPAPMSAAALTNECIRHLTPADLVEFQAVLAGDAATVHSSFGTAWLHANLQVRNAVTRARALRLGVDEKKYLQPHEGFRVDAERAVSDAYSRANPLERELALDRYRWSLADELSAGDAFGLPSLLAYAVKLGICERWQGMTDEKGRDQLEYMVGVVGVSSQELAGWSGLAQL